MGAALAYTYRYPFASDAQPQPGGFALRLATSGGTEGAEGTEGTAPNPHFFRGRIAYPRETADQLITIAQTVSSRFFMPNLWRLTDPVVTANDNVLRFEGFSSCCGVYARADMKAESFEADFHGRGTTNVDFSSAMRAALARIRSADRVQLSVGAQGVTLEHKGSQIIEKKVKLPIRWIKGFSEVQAYLPTLTLRLDIPAAEARAFIQSLPKGGGPKQPSYATPLGRGLRLSQRPSKDAVRITGTDRLRLLEPLMPHIRGLRIWSNEDAGVCAWELLLPTGHFVVLLSPEVNRGFSGEGQVLDKLATGQYEDALPRLRAALHWQARVEPAAIAQRSGLPQDQVDSALAVLGARGLVGYDLAEHAYFHRELPFDLGAVESLQPRLKDARKLVAEKKVRITEKQGEGDTLRAIAFVQGTDVEHRVQLLPEGDKCTCPWYSKNQGLRGYCKHVLAARIAIEGEE